MYAVVVTGGKQYRVEQGTKVRVEKLSGEAGSTVTLDQVLMVGDGSDLLLGARQVVPARVTADIVGQGRGKKVEIIKFRRRKHHMKRQGHRQAYTELKITGISA